MKKFSFAGIVIVICVMTLICACKEYSYHGKLDNVRREVGSKHYEKYDSETNRWYEAEQNAKGEWELTDKGKRRQELQKENSDIYDYDADVDGGGGEGGEGGGHGG